MTKKKPLPAALVRNATKRTAAASRVAAAEARALITEIREKKRQIENAFYDIGVALTALTEPRLYTALGHSSFAALVENEIGIGLATAKRWIAIPKQLTRKRALSLGQTKSLALIRLAAATPEPDTAEELARGKRTVRGRHAPIEPGTMSAREIERVVKTERRAHRSKSVRPSDAALAAAEAWAERAQKGLKGRVKVDAKRGRDGSARLIIECAYAERAAVGRALAAQR